MSTFALTPRRLVQIGVILALLVSVGIGGRVYLTSWNTFEVRAYHQIQMGMTLPEITAVIGQPPGNYSNRPPVVASGGLIKGSAGRLIDHAGMIHFRPTDGAWSWWWNDYSITVHFDGNGKAVTKELFEFGHQQGPTLFERARRWLGL